MARTSTIEGGLMDHGCRQDQADVPSIFQTRASLGGAGLLPFKKERLHHASIRTCIALNLTV